MSAIIEVRVHPRARVSKVKSFDSDRNLYEVDIDAPAEHGSANKELLRIMKKHLGKVVRIKHGFTGRRKILEIQEN